MQNQAALNDPNCFYALGIVEKIAALQYLAARSDLRLQAAREDKFLQDLSVENQDGGELQLV